MSTEIISVGVAEKAALESRLEQLREELDEAERRLHLTLDAAGATGAWDWDIAGRRLYGDPRFAALTGLDAVDLERGVPPNEFFHAIHPDDQRRIRLAVAGILAGAEIFSRDYRLVRADGTTRWVHAKGRAILSEDDQPVRFVGDLVDVTEQKRFQEQLRVAQTAGGIGTFEHADGFGTVNVSEQFCHLLGLHPTKVLPVATVNGLVHPEDRPIIEPILPDVPRPDLNVEFRVVRADSGERRWLARRGEYVSDLSGPGLRYIGVIYDITELKRIEERLRHVNEGLSERVRKRTQDLNRVWQNSSDLLAVLDLDGTIRDVNPAWLHGLNLRHENLVGGNFYALLRDGGGQVEAASDQAASSARFECGVVDGQGNVRTVAWATSREENSVYVYGRDLSVQRAQEAALRETDARLRQSQKMEAVGQLTGGIAHDFNNMLTGVLGSLEIVRRRLASGRVDDLNRFIDAATASGQRAAALTHRLLAFSRRQSLDPRPTDVAGLIHGMIELLARTLGEHVQLDVEVTGTWHATTDANQLESAILNLAINARDAMPDGGRLLIAARNVSLSPGQVSGLEIPASQDFVVVEASDTGQGMPPDVLEKAFDPFFTTKPIGQGTGLGLSMVYGFAKQSGGTAEIASEAGRGTTVSIYLPRSDQETSTPHVQFDETVPAGAGQLILIVEDDPSVRLLVREILTDLGYRYMEAGDADAAIKILRANKFDLLVSDVGLPGINGRQLAEIAREMHPGIKVLFITGYAETAASRGTFLAEGMDMLSKPFESDSLGNLIGRMLNEGAA